MRLTIAYFYTHYFSFFSQKYIANQKEYFLHLPVSENSK